MQLVLAGVLRLTFKVSHKWWADILACHGENTHLGSWEDYPTILMRAGLAALDLAPNMLGTMLDQAANMDPKSISLFVTPSQQEQAQIANLCTATGYTRDQIIPRLVRIGYKAIC